MGDPTPHADRLRQAWLAGGCIGGMMIGPLAFGAVVDATQSYHAGWLMVVATFVVAGVLGLGLGPRVIPMSAQHT